MSTGDSSEVWPPMEELDDAKRLLGGRAAVGDTVQGEVNTVDPHGHTHKYPSSPHQPPPLCTYVCTGRVGLGPAAQTCKAKQGH